MYKRLKEAGFRARRPLVRPTLRQRHRNYRVTWGQNHQWTQHQWRKVLFSDESRFKLRQSDGRNRVYRRTGERFEDDCIFQTEAFGGGSVIVWAGISIGGRTDLVFVDGNLNSQLYINEILRPHVLPYLGAMEDGAIFQDDNARPHRGRIVTAFLEQNGVQHMNWPAISPDMSPIEHLRDMLDRQLRPQIVKNSTLNDVRRHLQAAWHNVPQQQIDRLIRSMSRGVLAQ